MQDEYETEFYETYNGDTSAYGSYMSDVLAIGGMTVPNLTMGLVNSTTASTYLGVLGIGYNDSDYDNLPNRLQKEGLINSTAYSLWVDDETAGSGSLLFGAIDTSRFEGDLTRLMSYYSYYMMIVPVVGINGSTSDSSGPVAITVTSDDDDDGSSSSYSSYTSEGDGDDDGYLFTAVYSPSDTVSNLPTDIAAQVWQMAGASYDPNLAVATISCSAAADEANFTLQLGSRDTKGPVISARLSDLVIPADEFNLTSYFYSIGYYYYYSYDASVPGPDTCLFGVQNGSSSLGGYYYGTTTYNLGSTLLRRTYSVFDLVNNEIAVAPVKFGSADDATAGAGAVVPFASYGAAAPSSTVLCTYSTCYDDDGTGSSSSDGEGTAAGDTGRLPGVLSVGALLGLSLGLGVGFLALGLVGFLLWRRRLSRRPAAGKEEAAAEGREEVAAGTGVGPVVPSGDNTVAGAAAASRRVEDEAEVEADRMPAETLNEGMELGKGKGKAPEVREPPPVSPIAEPHEASAANEARSSHHADGGEPSTSGRNV